ncbi:MAG TPA: hypothetical protein VGP25_05225 [Gemmatimonadaceae bacterium]|jgi:hypothetical protein|nr:hypothetical protein [Gemmatimonadaceae bacterium]
MHVTRRSLAVLLVFAASCASQSKGPSAGAPSASASSTPRAARPNRNPDVISTEELRDPVIAGSDAMTAIRQLRPTFFRTRGPQSFSNATAGEVQISQDYGPLQPLSQLSGVDTRSLVEVRYLNSNDAQSRFGINANGGPVIVLLSSTTPK